MYSEPRRLALPDFPVGCPDGVSLALPARGDVHLWAFDLNDRRFPESDFWSSLSEDERDAARQILHPFRRRQKAMTRGMLRRLLSAYVGVADSAFRFIYSAYGKPALADPGIGKLRFNLSHGGTTALFAFSSEMEIGVDVEPLERKHLLADPSRLLSDTERASWERLSSGMRERALLAFWVRKEAMAKALGKGLSIPLTRLTVDRTDCGSIGRLAICDLAWPQGHLSAVAATGDLRCLRFGTVATPAEVSRPC